MYTEIYSDADIRNGRRLLLFLYTVIAFKEIAVIAGLWTGHVAAGSTLPPGALPFIAPEAMRAAAAFGFTLLLMALTYNGHAWARLSLGIIYVFISANAGLNALRAPDAFQTDASKIALGNAALGLLLGLIISFAPPLRAFGWSQANRRRAIPVPLDDQPARRAMRRERTLGEALIALFRMMGNLVFIGVILALGALIYGFSEALLGWLRP